MRLVTMVAVLITMVDFLFVNATQTMQFCFNKTREMIKNFTIVNEDKKQQKASVTLTGYVASYNSENSFNSAKFIEMFNTLKATNTHIHIDIVNLYGGSITEGIPVYNHIKETAAEGSVKITGKIEGLAASMGSIIAMAIPVDNLEMGNMARIMNHKAKGGAYGTADEVRNTAEMIQGYEDDMISILAERTGMTSEEVAAKWMDGLDHFIKADEAKLMKLVGNVSESKIKKNLPKNFKSPEEAFNFFETNLVHNYLNTDMELEKQLRETLKLGADESIVDAVAKLQADAAVKPKYDALVQQNIDSQEKEVQALMTKLKDGKLITDEQAPT
ncbi:ATP-dependent Clp protease proteolytic subunit, partial [Lutibacter sp.]|uniref:Clp protease ClpP n=1 Tax=Lutibacter sp. TaxID=1925666 RepID=UPI00356708CC